MAIPGVYTPTLTAAMALAAVEQFPMSSLLLDGRLCVVGASGSFREAFAIDDALMDGTPVWTIGGGEWDVAELKSLLGAALGASGGVASGEMQFSAGTENTRHFLLQARRLDCGSGEPTRILLNATDITDACLEVKAKDDLLLEKAVELQETQHRIANNLQIIGALLMQSVERCPSPETKSYLVDAHSRVMSVAELQREISSAPSGKVQVRQYLERLCTGIRSAMIGDGDPITVAVSGDDGPTAAELSGRLGLIVTELVTNALKHAFAAGRGGNVLVEYRRAGSTWTLSVADDGVGMPPRPDRARAGLGTSIIEGLARRLRATISVSDLNPGTCVRLSGNAM